MVYTENSRMIVPFILLLLSLYSQDVFGTPTKNSFILTNQHRELLKEIQLTWDPTENGAPMLHPTHLLGSPHVLRDAERIAKVNRDGAKALLMQLPQALATLMTRGQLPAGRYQVISGSLPDPFVAFSQIDFVASEESDDFAFTEKPKLTDGEWFAFSDKHLKVIRAMAPLWEKVQLDPEQSANAADWIPLTIDPKRPYGDMTYYPIDLARILGIALDNQRYDEAQDLPPFTLEKLKSLVKIHFEMLPALKVFLQAAVLSDGASKPH